MTVGAGDGWIGEVPAGGRLRIVDLCGNQAVDTLFFDAHDYANRYSAVDTVREQGAVYLTTGSVLLSVDLDPLAVVVADTCGRHDTLGGACAQRATRCGTGSTPGTTHACRTTFVRQATAWGRGLEKRDLTHNVNFFMNVPLTPDGGLTFEDGVSAPGKYVELRAERDVLVLSEQLPATEQPVQRLDPTPVRLAGWPS
ncbi:DUF1989 domain-containing protein [Yinghuangia aomiensis]